MPPLPSFSGPSYAINPVSSAGSITPSSAAGSIAQSPFSSLHYPSAFSPSVINSVGQHASPVKKKLSLSDYKARLKKAPEQPVGGKGASDQDSIQASSANTEEAKESGVLEGSAIVDSPIAEKGTDPMGEAAEVLTNGVSTRLPEAAM